MEAGNAVRAQDLNVVSYYLPVSVLEYQTAILREDFETAERILPKIPADQRSKIARFLEAQGAARPAAARAAVLHRLTPGRTVWRLCVHACVLARP